MTLVSFDDSQVKRGNLILNFGAALGHSRATVLPREFSSLN